LAGFGLEAMRIPVALLAAASVPVVWLLGRRILGSGPATVATLLLATSPVFLVYGRTATLVGVSTLPLLLSALALARVLAAGATDGWSWRREGVFAGSLLLGIFAYAPVRLVWPLAVGMLCLAALRSRTRRPVLVRTALLGMLIVPGAMMALERFAAPEPDPVAAAAGYFHARGEQLVAMSADPAEAVQYLRAGDVAAASGWETAARLVAQNVSDLANLLLDRDTGPAPVDYWSEHGRFWPWFLLPFAVIGAGASVRAGSIGRGSRLTGLMPIVFFLGLALPLLFTSRVHIGRLLPALPFALLLAAMGIWTVTGWLATVARRAGAAETARWMTPFLAGAVLLPAVAGARADMDAPFAPSREWRSAMALADWQEAVAERGSAVLVEDPALGDDIERIHAATYRLHLDGLYRFADLQRNAVDVTDDPRPALLWRGALGTLQEGEIVHPCDRLWFVTPEIAGEFFAAWHAAGCIGVPDSVILP
ncbi:MAG: glycosyltransferase family 39 protein, partial [Thermomicrobiales bacterium]